MQIDGNVQDLHQRYTKREVDGKLNELKPIYVNQKEFMKLNKKCDGKADSMLADDTFRLA